jgi:hypothetical protein
MRCRLPPARAVIANANIEKITLKTWFFSNLLVLDVSAADLFDGRFSPYCDMVAVAVMGCLGSQEPMSTYQSCDVHL